MKNLILASVALSFSSAAFAVGTSNSTVKWMISRASDNLHYMSVSTTHDNRPACATTTLWAIADESSKTGQNQWNMLMAAKVSGKEVIITGSGKCTRWGDMEDIDSVRIK